MKTNKFWSMIMMLVLIMGATLSISSCSEDEGGTSPNKKKPNTNGHAYVDLGLPSGTLWATMNIGANTPEGYGWILAWGETMEKRYYDYSTYFDYVDDSDVGYFKKYNTNGGKYTLDPEDDAAHVFWGGDWRIPTPAELDELRNTDNCTWTWTTQNDVWGYKVTSRRNSKSIFLPAAGHWGGLNYLSRGEIGNYWSSLLYASSSGYSGYAYYLEFDSRGVKWYQDNRINGRSIRAVCP